MPAASYKTRPEKNATAPNIVEPKPASSPTTVDSAQTEAECADGMPPIPDKRVKSGRFCRNAANRNLSSCAEKSAASAIASGGFQSTKLLKILSPALYGELRHGFQFG